jgi:hypothetical protein
MSLGPIITWATETWSHSAASVNHINPRLPFSRYVVFLVECFLFVIYFVDFGMF